MKYCTHCGKELLDEAVVCIGCGCAVSSLNSATTPVDATKESDEYTTSQYLEKNSKLTLILSIAGFSCIVLGIILFLSVSPVAGILVSLLSLIFWTIPSESVRKEFKSNSKDKTKFKAYSKKLRKSNIGYRLNYIGTFVFGVVLIIFGLCMLLTNVYASTLPRDLQLDDYGSGIVDQLSTIKDCHDFSSSDFYNFSRNFN